MKKQHIAIVLLAAALLGLAACSRGSSGSGAARTSDTLPSPNADEMAMAAASDTDAAASRQSHVPPASSTDLEIDGEAFDKAADCIGASIFDLYAAIGQPLETPTYTASDQGDNAQNGTLVYRGFTVLTLRTDTQETVRDVKLTLWDDEPQPTQDVQPTQDAVG